MRGEHGRTEDPTGWTRGSSPHARGTRLPCVIAFIMPGIIPACAGNTTAFDGESGMSEDHPRMRGEHDLHEDQ